MMKPALMQLAKRIDASEYGGAILLGVKAPFIICHGSSKAKDIKSAVRVAADIVHKDIVGRIGEEVIYDEESGGI